MSINKYLEILKISWINSFAYWMNFLGSGIFMIILMFIFVNLWTVLYAGKSTIDGFSLNMMIWYLVFSEAIIFADPKIWDEIASEVKSGTVAYSLSKPYSYMFFKFMQYLGEGSLRFIVAFFVGSVVVLTMVGPVQIGLGILLLPISLVIALTVNFLFLLVIGLMAFWFEDVKSFYLIYHKFIFTLGGMLIPLEFFPKWLEVLSSYLPFATISYYPAKLFVAFSMDFFIKAIMFQLIWVLIMATVVLIIFNYAKRAVQIHGG